MTNEVASLPTTPELQPMLVRAMTRFALSASADRDSNISAQLLRSRSASGLREIDSSRRIAVFSLARLAWLAEISIGPTQFNVLLACQRRKLRRRGEGGCRWLASNGECGIALLAEFRPADNEKERRGDSLMGVLAMSPCLLVSVSPSPCRLPSLRKRHGAPETAATTVGATSTAAPEKRRFGRFPGSEIAEPQRRQAAVCGAKRQHVSPAADAGDRLRSRSVYVSACSIRKSWSTSGR